MTVEELKTFLGNGGQILKTRDDHAPIFVERREDPAGADQFTLADDSKFSWVRPEEAFGPEKLRPRIEPWLTALVQSEHLSLLIGSGLTHAVHGLSTCNGLPGMRAVAFDTLNDEITREAERAANAAGRENGNFEDRIRVANELLRGLEILALTKPEDAPERGQVAALRDGLN